MDMDWPGALLGRRFWIRQSLRDEKRLAPERCGIVECVDVEFVLAFD
jgi:hypothetical protein